MATQQELETALINADKAGDIEASKALASEIIKLRSQTPTQQELSTDSWNMYFNGQMSPEDKTNIENQVKAGTIKLPENVTSSNMPTIPMSPERPQDTGVVLQKQYTPMEKIQAGLQSAGTLVSGATTGAIGNIAGATTGIIDSMLQGTFGTQQGAKQAQKTAEEMAQAGTYQPDNQLAQQYTQNVAGTLEPLTAMTPLGAEARAASQNIKQAIPKTQKVEIPKVEPAQEPHGLNIIATISKKAIKGDKDAKAQLAEQVRANPEAIKAADRLGIELPADVLGDSELIKQTAGLVRSQIGEASADWVNTLNRAVDKADEAMSKLGKTNIADTSANVFDELKSRVSSLGNISSKLYDDTLKTIPKSQEVQPINSLNKLEESINDLGGVKFLSKEEKQLFNLVNQDTITMGALEKIRREVGQAIGKNPQGRFGNSDQSLLKSVYASLKQDQLENVEAISGLDARKKLELADKIFQKKMSIEDTIVDNFGRNGEKSISRLLTNAINQGASGDITALNKALKVVPKNLQKETFITALADATQSKRGLDYGNFDFNNYTKVYEGLKNNKPIYNRLLVTIGGDKKQILEDLNTVSKRITDARKNVLTTGKANQEILKKFQEEALAEKIIKFTILKGDKLTGGMVGVNNLQELLFKTPKEKLTSLGDLLKSNEFFELSKQAIEGTPTNNTIKNFVNSWRFKKWKKAIGKEIKEPETFILESINLNQQQGQNNDK